MIRASSGDDRQAGFALMETLVASAIIAGMLGVTYQAVETTARSARDMQYRREGILIAQSLLAGVGADIPLSPGTVSGSRDGLGWRIDMEPYTGGEDAARSGGPALLIVRVSIMAPGREQPLVGLQSLRIAA